MNQKRSEEILKDAIFHLGLMSTLLAEYYWKKEHITFEQSGLLQISKDIIQEYEKEKYHG